MSMTSKYAYIAARSLSIILLVWALDKHPIGYYTILRFIVCGVSAYGVYLALELERRGWAWILGAIAVLFNPLIKVYLDKSTWAGIDLCVGILFLISIFSLKRKVLK